MKWGYKSRLEPADLLPLLLFYINEIRLFSFGNKRQYEEFEKQIPANARALFSSLRDFCLSIDEKVIEDVRMHRVVFCKSMTFRWFADIEPTNEGVIVKIQKNRKNSPEIMEVKIGENIENVTSKILYAFNNVS